MKIASFDYMLLEPICLNLEITLFVNLQEVMNLCPTIRVKIQYLMFHLPVSQLMLSINM